MRLHQAAIVACLLNTSCASTPTATVEREIEAADAERVRALQADDLAALERVYADDFIMITSTGEIRTKADQLRDIGSGRFTHPPAPTRTLRLRVYGDVAVVHSENKGGLAIDGRADPVLRRVTRVYVKRDGRWLLESTHISQSTPPATEAR